MAAELGGIVAEVDKLFSQSALTSLVSSLEIGKASQGQWGGIKWWSWRWQKAPTSALRECI